MFPMMGFPEEQIVPGHVSLGNLLGKEEKEIPWAPFYTCIANGRRIFLWGNREPVYLMLSDHVTDPGYKAEEAELMHMFAAQHRRNPVSSLKETKNKYRLDGEQSTNALLLQALIHELTLKGNLT